MTIETSSTLVIKLTFADAGNLSSLLSNVDPPVSLKEADMRMRLIEHLNSFIKTEFSKSRTQYD